METLQFKTNINCGGCIAKVAPYMNESKNIIKSWKVDTTNPQRILTVETEAGAEAVEAIVAQAGFKAEEL
ncbi:MAG TPA: heavy metal transport/detoxification protein [Flavipsychrobacter sp.]|nr:heavy metal transport/detoxification protein [Flavipsychrobacter sp.]